MWFSFIGSPWLTYLLTTNRQLQHPAGWSPVGPLLLISILWYYSPACPERTKFTACLWVAPGRRGKAGENIEIKSQRLWHWTPAAACNLGFCNIERERRGDHSSVQDGAWSPSTVVFPLGQLSNLKVKFWNLSKIPLKSNMKKTVVIGAHETVKLRQSREDPSTPEPSCPSPGLQPSLKQHQPSWWEVTATRESENEARWPI